MGGERAIAVDAGEVGAGGRSGQRSATEMSSAAEMCMTTTKMTTAEMCVTTAEVCMTTAEVTTTMAATEMTATTMSTAAMTTASGVGRARKRQGEYNHRKEVEL